MKRLGVGLLGKMSDEWRANFTQRTRRLFQLGDSGGSRLCRVMCGPALPFRNALYSLLRLRLIRAGRGAASPVTGSKLPERLSLSAHQAAKPRYLESVL
jgi:hypothetical protein